MAVLLALGSLFPVLVGFFSTGDFPQLLIKPPRSLIFQVFKYRYAVVAASVILFVLAIVLNATSQSVSPVFFVVVGFLMIFLAVNAFWAVPTMVFPTILKRSRWVSVDEANKHLSPSDEVIALAINGDARAYPLKWIVRPHVVQDTVGGEPIAMTYCGLSHLGMAFRPEFDGKPMNLQVMVQIENNLVLYDPNNDILIQQIDGAVSFGDKQGQELSQVPTRIMSWEAWQKLYPQTKVFFNPPHGIQDRAIRKLVSFLLTRHYSHDIPTPVFRTIERFDARLPAKSYVIGVEVHGQRKAYSLDYLRNNPVVNDTVNGLPLVIVCDKAHDIVDVFERTCDGQTLTFQSQVAADQFAFSDKETGTQWNIKGEAANRHLQGYPHANRVFWMVWYNYYPDTALLA